MESHGEHKPARPAGRRDKTLLIYWMVIGVGLGIVIGTSTGDWIISLISGVVIGAGMAFMATKPGVDQ